MDGPFLIIGRIKNSHAGRTRGFRSLRSERQGQEDRRLRAGEGSHGRTSGNRRFLWGRVLDRTAAAPVNRLRFDGMRDSANSKADITRVIHEEPAFAELFIATSWLVTVVSRRTWSINCSIPARNGWRGSFCFCEFWQGRSTGANRSENQPRDTGRDDRHEAKSREFFHEQISGIRSY